MQASLHAGPVALEWMLSGYTLALTVGLISGARLGDLLGHKRVFVAGVAGFAAASAVCSLSDSPGMLVAARIVQGLFAAAMIPQVLSLVQLLYRAEERGPAMAAYSALSGIAATAEPILGPALLGWNLDDQGWRLVFWVNVPVGAFAAIAAARLLPGERGSGAGRPDLPGALVAGAGLTLVVYPLIAASGNSGCGLGISRHRGGARGTRRVWRPATPHRRTRRPAASYALPRRATPAPSPAVPPAWPAADRICPGHCGPAAPLTARRALSMPHGSRQLGA